MNKKELFLHKWFPRFFYKKFDGGKESVALLYLCYAIANILLMIIAMKVKE